MGTTTAGRSSRRSDGGSLKSGFLTPRSLGVIGTSAHLSKVGYAVLANIIKSGYPGDLFTVNPKESEIRDVKCYPDVGSLPETPELGEMDMNPVIVYNAGGGYACVDVGMSVVGRR